MDLWPVPATELALWVWFAGWASILALVDVRAHRLPNAMVATAFLGCVAFTTVHAVASSDLAVVSRAGAASLVALAAFAIAHLVGGMGMGDVKYAAVTGWMLGTIGWWAVWWGHVLGFMIAGLVVLLGLSVRAMRRTTAVPFGPFMGGGVLIVGLWALAS